MKTNYSGLIFGLALSLALSSAAWTTEGGLQVDQSATLPFGIVKIDGDNAKEAGYEIPVSTPWIAEDGVSDLSVSNFLANGIAEGDQLSVYTGASGYNVYEWNGESWEAAKDSGTGEAPDLVTIQPGAAVWYKRNSPGKLFSLIGQVKSPVVTTSSGIDKVILVDPFRSERDVLNVLDGSTFAENDSIVLRDGHYFFRNGKWCKKVVTVTPGKTIGSITFPAKETVTYEPIESLPIESGEPFWLDVHNSGSNVEAGWTTEK